MPLSPAEKAAKKEEQRREGEKNMAEYHAAKLAEQKKTERLRALRLAHEARQEQQDEPALAPREPVASARKSRNRKPRSKKAIH